MKNSKVIFINLILKCSIIYLIVELGGSKETKSILLQSDVQRTIAGEIFRQLLKCKKEIGV